MKSKRIVSFLPSATELIYELEAQGDIHPKSHTMPAG